MTTSQHGHDAFPIPLRPADTDLLRHPVRSVPSPYCHAGQQDATASVSFDLGSQLLSRALAEVWLLRCSLYAQPGEEASSFLYQES